MEKLINFKIALEDLKQRKETENLSEEVYNQELRKIYKDYQRLKKKSLENEFLHEVKTKIYSINLITPPS